MKFKYLFFPQKNPCSQSASPPYLPANYQAEFYNGEGKGRNPFIDVTNKFVSNNQSTITEGLFVWSGDYTIILNNCCRR